MEAEIRTRLKWVELYERTGNAGMTCLRCGSLATNFKKMV